MSSGTLHHFMAPNYTKPHIHCCTDKLDPPDAVDLDWFNGIIFAEHYLCGIGPGIQSFTKFEGKHDHEGIRFEGIIIFNESFPYSMMQSIGA
jgi:hypothetical protein